MFCQFYGPVLAAEAAGFLKCNRLDAYGQTGYLTQCDTIPVRFGGASTTAVLRCSRKMDSQISLQMPMAQRCVHLRRASDSSPLPRLIALAHLCRGKVDVRRADSLRPKDADLHYFQCRCRQKQGSFRRHPRKRAL